MYFNCCELLIFVTFVTITTHMISCHLMAAKINLDQDGNFDMDDLSASEALRARGYLAKEFRFYTRDGYKLHLVRGRNPLIKQTYEIKRKNPILFIHGAFAGPGCFVYHSAKVKPKDFSKLDTNDEAVIEALKFEPSAKALPFLAMNFGHDIWLLARRGIAGSNDYKAGHLNRTIEEILTSIPVATLNTIIKTRPQIKRIRTQPKTETKRPQKRQQDDIIKQAFNSLNETTQLNWNKFNDLVKYNRYTLAHEFDADYWRFTYDEQADYDVPETIDFILSQSSYGVKVGLVGWSAGGLTILMSLSIYPRQLEHKVASVVLWSPALNLGTASDMVRELGILKPLIEPNYKAPLPPVFAVKPIKALVRSFCKIDIIQKTICNPIIEAVLGPVDKYSQYKPFVNLIAPEATGDLELSQLVQNPGMFYTRKYRYDSREYNRKLYGSDVPPLYNFSRIRQPNIAIFVGNTDRLTSVEDMQITSSQLAVPHSLNVINSDGIKFNHMAYLTHDLAAELVMIPSMQNLL